MPSINTNLGLAAFVMAVVGFSLPIRPALAQEKGRPGLPVPAAAADSPTEIGRRAGALKPGQWVELKSQGYDFTTLMRGDDILAYTGKAAWDARSEQVLFIGQVHLKGPPVFISYAVRDNTWKRQPTPPWAEKLKWFHAYDNNAADSAHGIFYHHASASRQVHRYDVAKKTWTTLPDLKGPVGHGTALEYFPELKGLVRVLGGSVWFWSEEKNAWSQRAAKLDMGPYHNFACYSPRFKTVLLGGGNGSGAVYRLDAQGKLAAGKNAPLPLGIGRTLNVVDPASGEMLVLAKDRKFLAYHPGKDEWRELPSAGVPFSGGHSVAAVPLGRYGVVLFFSSRPQGMKTFLYKHAEARPDSDATESHTPEARHIPPEHDRAVASGPVRLKAVTAATWHTRRVGDTTSESASHRRVLFPRATERRPGAARSCWQN